MVDTRFCHIYVGADHEDMGQGTSSGWTWDAEVISRNLPTAIDIPKLKRDSLIDKPRKR